MVRVFVTMIVTSMTFAVFAADSLPKRTEAPQSVDELWADYDPGAEPVEATRTQPAASSSLLLT